MNNVTTRSISGTAYVALIVAAIICGPWAFAALTMLLIILASIEVSKLFSKGGCHRWLIMLVDLLGAFSIFAGGYIAISQSPATALPAAIPMIPFIIYLLLRIAMELFLKYENPVVNLAQSIFGTIYVALPLTMMYTLYIEAGKPFVLAMFILIWVNDTGAFIAGSSVGRRKLFPRVSPNKTWEGVLGGLAFAITAAIFMGTAAYNYFGENELRYAILAVTTVVMATVGDLVESLFKRAEGVKDSGNIIPGHGGILDRIDSLLFVAPASLCLFYIF